MTKRFTRRWTAAAAAAVVAVGLAACSSGSGPAQPADLKPVDDGATLTMWARAGRQPIFDPIVKAYNDSHKNQISITYVPEDQYVTKFATAIASSSAPDIASFDVIYAPQFVAGKQLTDVTSALGRLSYHEDLLPAHMASLSDDDGHEFGVPVAADMSLIYYNKTLFAKAGLDPDAPPRNWDEMLAAAKAIKALGSDEYGLYMPHNNTGQLQFDFTPFIWAAGGKVTNPDGSFVFDDDATRAALRLFKTAWDAGYFPDSAKSDDGVGFVSAFAKGNIGMSMIGGGGSDAYASQHLPFDYGVMPIPGPKTGEVASFAGGDVAGISAGAQHPDQAWDFLSWLTSDTTQLDVYGKLHSIPIRSDLVAKLPADAGEFMTVPAGLLEYGHQPRSTHLNEVMSNVTGPYLTMFRDYLFNGVDLDAAVTKAQKDADAITGR